MEGTTKEADAVICNFSGTPDSIRVSTDLLFGKIKQYPKTKLPITPDVDKAVSDKKLKPPKKKHPLDLSYC
jgi:hypothetical protein